MDASTASVLGDLLHDPWFQLTFLLVVSLFASFLFARFGQPKVIGYIVVGVVIGGSVLGIIESPIDGGGGTEPAESTPAWALAKLGSIILMFMIGLQCELKEIYSRRSIVIALGGVLLPWVAGYYTANLMGYGEPESVFIGAALVATSVAITASVMSELGMVGTPVAYALLGAAVIDDILGMIVLAISGGIAAETLDYIEILMLGVAAVAFIAVAGFVGSRYITKLVFQVQVSGYRRKLPMSGFV
ncbi:MAG TPA: cation:proton antiporter, partial [Thermoplasmata archaeon]